SSFEHGFGGMRSGSKLINVALEKTEIASIINQLPKNELQGVLGEDSIRKPLNEEFDQRLMRRNEMASIRNQS
ncbi:hypothetical protein Tco_1188904, partial [Tanacetum coccineum]